MSFAVDLHTHTRHGSNCSYMEPRDLVRRAEEVGLDAVCITEHNASWEEDALRALDDGTPLRLFGGMEVSTECGDVLVFGLEDTGPRKGGIEELRRIVDRSGGVMIAAHPFRRYSVSGVAIDIAEACQWPLLRFVDAAEVFNGISTRREVELAQEVLTRLGLRGVGGSDSHAPHTLGSCYTVFERPLATVRDLVKEVKASRFQAVHRGFELTF
jgi:histidinol phosphatase-like PHP family hydrolase